MYLAFFLLLLLFGLLLCFLCWSCFSLIQPVLFAIFRWVGKKKNFCPSLTLALSYQAVVGRLSCVVGCWLHTLMPSSVAVLHCIGYMRLLSRLLGQLRRMAPSRNGDRGSHGLPYSSWGCSVTVDSLSAGRRSLLCRIAPPGPVWVLPSHCPARSSSFDSFCSSSHKSAARKMSSSTSSSSSANNEQGKPKSKSPFRKRGSLQSTTSPGECGSQWGGGRGGSHRNDE